MENRTVKKRRSPYEIPMSKLREARKLVEGSNDNWLVWCDYNIESETLHSAIRDSVEVQGKDNPEFKALTALRFADGEIKALISKPSIYGFGMNFQNCHEIIFCGISDSYEQFYQAVRRCWRYGQTHSVNVHIILSEAELNVLENIKKKQSQMDELQENMVSLMHDVTMSEIKHTTRITTDYKPQMEFKYTLED